MINYNAILSINVVTPPSVEPVTLQEAKDYMRVDYNDEDALITLLIKTSRALIETKYNVGIIQKGLSVVVNNSAGGIDLPGMPIGTVAAVDKDGNTVDIAVSGGYMSPAYCEGNLTVTYNSGYALNSVPEHFKTAIKAQVLYNFENRGSDMDNMPEVSPQTQMIMNAYSRNTMGMFL